MKINNYKIKKIALLSAKILGSLFLLVVLSFFLLRSYFLHKAIDKIAAKFKNKYQATFTVGNASFVGLSGVALEGISIVPDGKDTLLRVDYFTSSIRFGYLFLGEVRVKELNLKNGYLQLIRKGAYKNFSSFLTQSDTTISIQENTEEKTQINYAKEVYKVISRVLAQVPNSLLVDRMSLKVTDNDKQINLSLQELSLDNQVFDSKIIVTDNLHAQKWRINGTAKTKERKADLNIERVDSEMVLIPYLRERFGLMAGFSKIRLQLDGFEFANEQLKIDGTAAINNLTVNHARIAKSNVVINNASINYHYLLGKNFVSLDSSTTVTFNETTFHPFCKLEERVSDDDLVKRVPKNKSNLFYRFFDKYIVAFSVSTDKTMAQSFINSLPNALFRHIQGMQASGSFTYRLDFKLDIHKPDEMVFDSEIIKDNLYITQYGQANLEKLNGSFLHTPYERGIPQRSFIVGEENPNYVPYNLISAFIKKAILTTEDPSFMYHRGFVNEAFRQSIAKNIRTGKFSRGASTISMQLIKNVFLTREKTMARKLEEILLVYILENNHIVAKERMFEVYLNLIEWGPNIYGIGEATKFYFQKAPSELSLTEALYLASIVPSPKGFMYKFEKEGTIKPYMERNFQFIVNKMVSRSLILPDDTVGLNLKVNISGLAKKYIIKNDTIVNDSIYFDDNGVIENME